MHEEVKLYINRSLENYYSKFRKAALKLDVNPSLLMFLFLLRGYNKVDYFQFPGANRTYNKDVAEKKGYITSNNNANDRRRNELILTDKGEQLIKDVEKHLDEKSESVIPYVN